MMPVIKKDFDLMGDDIVEKSTAKKTSKSKTDSCDEKWTKESEGVLKQFDDDKRAKLILSRMQKQMKKQF